ncbi:MAG: hypothetical protein D6805_06155 [Planctomycetota bacterium]|nr:MAG: hypothetical protein D6805_06155 [Planctomycetota bacterium]
MREKTSHSKSEVYKEYLSLTTGKWNFWEFAFVDTLQEIQNQTPDQAQKALEALCYDLQQLSRNSFRKMLQNVKLFANNENDLEESSLANDRKVLETFDQKITSLLSSYSSSLQPLHSQNMGKATLTLNLEKMQNNILNDLKNAFTESLFQLGIQDKNIQERCYEYFLAKGGIAFRNKTLEKILNRNTEIFQKIFYYIFLKIAAIPQEGWQDIYEEFYQEFYTYFLKHRKKIFRNFNPNTSSFSTYLNGIFRNVSRDYIKNTLKNKTSSLSLETLLSTYINSSHTAHVNTISNDLENDEKKIISQDILRKFQKSYQNYCKEKKLDKYYDILFKYWLPFALKSLSTKKVKSEIIDEIATYLNLKPNCKKDRNTASQNLKRAKKHAKNYLKQYAITQLLDTEEKAYLEEILNFGEKVDESKRK